jgi:multiple sugar transport system ATP-binding protein
MREELHNLHSALGATFVYVTHDQLEAMTLSDRTVIMYNGKVQQIGAPLELYRRPRNKFVAGFIGTPSMNFIEDCRLLEEGGDLWVKSTSFSIKLPEDRARTIRVKDKNQGVKLGIRPENISIFISETNKAQPLTKARVSIVESIGPSLIVYAQINGQRLQIVCPADVEPKVGETIYLDFQRDRIHLFDNETEEALI